MTLKNQPVSNFLRQLEAVMEQLYLRRVGQTPDSVSCDIVESTPLGSTQIVISLKRPLSSTEEFLLKQRQLALAEDVSITIGQIIKKELVSWLKESNQLPVIGVSRLESASKEELRWLVLIDSFFQ